MRSHGVEVCVLFNEPNVRYATGASTVPVYAMSTLVRCAIVPQEGTPRLVRTRELDASLGHFERPTCVRCARGEFYDDPQPEADRWAEETLAVIGELGVAGEAVADDRLGRRRISRSRIVA